MSSTTTKKMPDFQIMTVLAATRKLRKKNCPNFPKWCYQIIPILKSQDLMKFVDGSHPPPPPTLESTGEEDGKSTTKSEPNPAYAEWKCIDQLLHYWLITTITKPVAAQVSGLNTSKELWDSLYRLFKSQAEEQIQKLRSQLQNIKLDHHSDIEEYVEQVKNLANKLEMMMREPVRDSDLITWTTQGLPPGHYAKSFYKPGIWTGSFPNPPTFDDFAKMLCDDDSKKKKQEHYEQATEKNQEHYEPEIKEKPKDNTFEKMFHVEGGEEAQQNQPDKQKSVERPSKASALVNFLPARTLLIFDMLITLVAVDTRKCNTVEETMMIILMCLCAASCIFAQLVDTYYDVEAKKVYHGIVTPKGLRVFNSDLRLKPDLKYKFRKTDIFHAGMAVSVFAVFAISDKRVTECLAPKREEEVFSQVRRSLPLMVSIICAGLNLLLPSPRFGVGMRG